MAWAYNDGVYSFISIKPLEEGLAGTRAQSCDRYGSGTLHPGQVVGGSLPLLSPRWCIYIYIYIYIFTRIWGLDMNRFPSWESCWIYTTLRRCHLISTLCLSFLDSFWIWLKDHESRYIVSGIIIFSVVVDLRILDRPPYCRVLMLGVRYFVEWKQTYWN